MLNFRPSKIGCYLLFQKLEQIVWKKAQIKLNSQWQLRCAWHIAIQITIDSK